MGVAAACQRIFRLLGSAVKRASESLARRSGGAAVVGTAATVVAVAAVRTVSAIISAALRGGGAVFAASDLASAAHKVLALALKDDILAQRALQRAVHHGDFLARSQADTGKVLVAVADNPGVVAGEYMLELGADEGVEGVHVVDTDALAVGRIGHHHAGRLRGLGPGAQRLALQLYVAGHAGALDIALGDGDSLGRDVGAVYLVGDGALAAVVVVQAVKELGVEVGPALKCKSAAEDAGVDVGGDEGCLDKECTRAAHGVDQRAVAAPAAAQDDACGEHLVDGGVGLGHAVAALVERLARGVEAQRDLGARYVHVDEHVGLLEAHSGALALGVAVAKPVDHGVLDLVGHEAAVAKLVAVAHRVDGKRLVGAEYAAPVVLLDMLVERVGIGGAEFEKRAQDAQRRAALQVGAVHRLQRAGKGHHAAPRHHILGSERAQLLGQHLFKTLEGLSHHFKRTIHNRQANIFAKVHKKPHPRPAPENYFGETLAFDAVLLYICRST